MLWILIINPAMRHRVSEHMYSWKDKKNYQWFWLKTKVWYLKHLITPDKVIIEMMICEQRIIFSLVFFLHQNSKHILWVLI